MERYQLAVVGAGPAGLTAGIYAGRAGLKTIVLDKQGYGGQMLLIHAIENFPGFCDTLNGFDLAQRMYDQMKKFGAEHKTAAVKSVAKGKDCFNLETDEGLLQAESVIIAAGAAPKKLGVPGEAKLSGRGVSYCAVCDGNFFKGKKVAVIGGGNTALQDAEYLSRIAGEVLLVHRRDEFRGDKVLQDRINNNRNIRSFLSRVVVSIEGTDKVNAVKLKNLKSGAVEDLPVDGVFIFVGQQPQTEFLGDFLKLDEKGFIETDGRLVSSVEGVFACGDSRRKEFWQLVTACSEGAESANNAAQYLAAKTRK